jgi:hypothetical protein
MEAWKSDPEAQYRRGFEEGAWALYRAAQNLLPGDANISVRQWLSQLDQWRLESHQSGRRATLVPPPALRLE